jgi:hypothetical protein
MMSKPQEDSADYWVVGIEIGGFVSVIFCDWEISWEGT